jgi:hypothetical protein
MHHRLPSISPDGMSRYESAAYLSADLVVVRARVFLGPAFRVSLVFSPLDLVAACFGCPAPRPAPFFTDFRPGLSAGALTLFLG